jgi:23S rRNA (uracil1939-C5)-methyltransferase
VNLRETEVVITTLAYGGDAVGQLADGRTVFVPFCLPGERVRIELLEERERFARGRLIRVLEASPNRTAARCRHFGACGGCHYQHMPYADQLGAKTAILRDQLNRIGQIENPPVVNAVGSTDQWNYRNQVQFQPTAEGRLGFVRAQADRNAPEVLGIEECHLPGEPINRLWPQLAFEADAGIERVAVRAGSDGELMLMLHSNSADVPELEIEASISVAHVFQNDVVIQAGEDHVQMRLLGRAFRVSPTSFFQVNEHVAASMLQHVLECVPAPVGTLIDAYCGVGLFSAFLAPRCRRLIGIEPSAAACEDFAANLDEFHNVELYQDTAGHVLPALDIRPDAVVVDPPRAGVEKTALDALVAMAPGVIIYVSCDPATLARDAARLMRGGYELERVTPFDMFPQTYHIESVSLFRR